MKLQLALDDITLEDALVLLHKVEPWVDIIELGTPFIIDYGMAAVREIKLAFPDKTILADLKIMDAGQWETELALRAGADIVTVLGVTDNLTIKACVEQANKYGKEIMADLICVDDLQSRIVQLEEMKVHIIAVHTGADQQATGRTPLDDLALLSKTCQQSKIAVAGGINQTTVDQYCRLSPDIIIVGSGITHSETPADDARNIYQFIHGVKAI